MLGHSFFPSLITAPFHSGLREAFAFSIGACLIAAVASFLRGKRYVDLGGTTVAAALGKDPAPAGEPAAVASEL